MLFLYSSGARGESHSDLPKVPTQLGTSASDCSGGTPLWMKSHPATQRSRDIYQKIAEKLKTIGPDERVDGEALEEKLSVLVGSKQVICCLILRPNGKIQEVKVLDNSVDYRHYKRAIALLNSIKQYGADEGKENLSYQVVLPKLWVSPL